MRRRGFSLMELLIVIGIITLLISILLPMVTRAREMANRTLCLSNIRQLQLGWLAYAEEHKGHFCTPYLCNQPTTAAPIYGINSYQAGGWLTSAASFVNVPVTSPLWGTIDFPSSRMWHYVPDINVYYCPNDTRPVKGATDSTRVSSPLAPLGIGSLTSYGMNIMMGNSYISRDSLLYSSISPLQANPLVMTKLSQIRHPESTFVFIEVHPSRGSPAFPLPLITGGGSVPVPTWAPPYHCRGSFAEGNTISFADGHAIFWNYTVPVNLDFSARTTILPELNKVDEQQILAWCGQYVSPALLGNAKP